MASAYRIPAMPRVVSPSPSLDERPEYLSAYTAPRTRSQTSRQRIPSPQPIAETSEEVIDVGNGKPKSPKRSRRRKSMRRSSVHKPLSTADGHSSFSTGNSSDQEPLLPKVQLTPPKESGVSRSPSPLSLIPIHRHFNSLIHKHELPRKGLHMSIGFITLALYMNAAQPSQITPVLLTALIPTTALDLLRHRIPPLNAIYIRICGALMRESEIQHYNGVIFYLAGACAALACFPKDVGVMAVLLLSWCDTAASSIGRLWGRYTPRVRKGKSLAGSLAAAAVGVLTALLFYGVVVPLTADVVDNSDENAFLFQEVLSIPNWMRGVIGMDESGGRAEGGWALAILSVWTGFVGAVSEAVDLWGWDDNFTIPVLSGIGIWGFLKIFG